MIKPLLFLLLSLIFSNEAFDKGYRVETTGYYAKISRIVSPEGNSITKTHLVWPHKDGQKIYRKMQRITKLLNQLRKIK